MFGTKNVDTKERGTIGKFLSFGISKAKIVSINVVKARSSEARKIEFNLEGEPITESGFEGQNGAKGKVARVATSYMSSDKQYQDFMRQIGTMADKMGVRQNVDEVKASTIEEYVTQIARYLTGIYAWWNIGAEEYAENKFTLNLPRFDFIKSIGEIDEESAVKEKGVIVSIMKKNGEKGLSWNKDNKYHFKKLEESSKPDNGFVLPGATQAAQTFNLPDVPKDSAWGGSSVDDLPFGGDRPF